MLSIFFLCILCFLAFWIYISVSKKEKEEKKRNKLSEEQQKLIEPEFTKIEQKKELVCEGDRCYLVERKKDVCEEAKESFPSMTDFIKNIPKIPEEDQTYIEENVMEAHITAPEVSEISKQNTKEEDPSEDRNEKESSETIQMNHKRETNSEDTFKDLEPSDQERNAGTDDKDFKKLDTIVTEKSEEKTTQTENKVEEEKDVFSEEIKDNRNYFSDQCMSVNSDKNFDSSNSSFSESGDSSIEESNDELDSSKESKKDSSDDDKDSDINSSNVEEEEEDSDEDDNSDDYSDSEDSTEEGIEDPLLKDKSVEEIKEIGNNYFKTCDYINAIYYYNKAIRKCKDKNTKSILYSNRAACNVLLQKWTNVIEDCTKSITYNNDFVKSYLRRSKAYEQMEKYNDASNDLNKALSLDPSLVSTYESKQKKLKIKAEEQLNKEKEEMVGKLKDFGNLLLGKVGLSLDNFEVQKNPNGDGSFNIQFKQNK